MGSIAFQQGLILAFSLLLGVVLLVVFIEAYVARGIQTECWRQTVDELDKVTMLKAGGIGRCLGKEEFKIFLGLRECGHSVRFTTFGGCLDFCRGIEDVKGLDHISKEECLDACLNCEGSRSCIMGVPKETGAFWNLWEKFRTGANKILTLPTGNYKIAGEEGDVVLNAPEKGADLYCIDFRLTQTDGKDYSISKVPVSEPSQCEVSRC